MNTIVEHINSLGHAFVEFALPMLIQSSVLIVILLLLDLLLRKKVKAVFRYWIWMLVLLKLILPTSLSSPLSLGYLFGEKLTYQDLAQTSLTLEPAVPAPAELSSGIGSMYIQPNPYIPPKEPVAPVFEPVIAEPVGPPEVPVTPLSWKGVVFLVWLAVVMAMGLLLLQRALFVRGLVAQAKKAGHLMNDALSYCCASMGIKAKVGLKISVNATTPSVCGLIRPVILVPWKLTSTLGASRLRTVLMHELAHIRRGDLWVNLAQTALQIIYFYNPLLWLANFVIRRIREQAVDEAVLVAMGEKAQKYPQTLVDVAKMAFKRPALGLRLIGVVESRSALAGRIKHILGRPMPKSAKLGIIGLLAVIIAGAVLLPMARAREAAFAGQGGPLNIRLAGVRPDGSDVIYDGDGNKIAENTFANIANEWGEGQQHRTFIFELPKTEQPILFSPFLKIKPAGAESGFGTAHHPLLYDSAGKLKYSVGVSFPRTYKKVFERRVRQVDLTLPYYYGQRGVADFVFYGPFTPGQTVKAEGGTDCELTPKEDLLNFGNHPTAFFRISSETRFDGDSVLIYDTSGRRYLLQIAGGGSGRSGTHYNYRAEGLTLNSIACVTVGEKPYEATFKNVVVSYPDRPVPERLEFLDEMCERLDLTGFSGDRLLNNYTFRNPADAVKVIDIVRGYQYVMKVFRAIRYSDSGFELSNLGSQAQQKVRSAVARWAKAGHPRVREMGIRLGLVGGWPEFMDLALDWLEQEVIVYDMLGRAYHGLEKEAKEQIAVEVASYPIALNSEQAERLKRIIMRTDSPRLATQLFRLFWRADEDMTYEICRDLVQDDRPWVWWPAMYWLSKRCNEKLRPFENLPEKIQKRKILVHEAEGGSSRLFDVSSSGKDYKTVAKEAYAMLPAMFTARLARMNGRTCNDVRQVMVKHLDREIATKAMTDFLREISTESNQRLWAGDSYYFGTCCSTAYYIARHINSLYDVNIDNLGKYETRENSEAIPRHISQLKQLIVDTLQWYDGRSGTGNESGIAAGVGMADRVEAQVGPLDHFVGNYALAGHPDTAAFEITKEGDEFIFRDLGGPKFEMDIVLRGLAGRSFEMEKGRDNLKFGEKRRDRFCVRYEADEDRYILDGLGMRGEVQDGVSFPLTDLVKISPEDTVDKKYVQVKGEETEAVLVDVIEAVKTGVSLPVRKIFSGKTDKGGSFEWETSFDPRVRFRHGWYTVEDGMVREHVGAGGSQIPEEGKLNLKLDVEVKDNMLNLKVQRVYDLDDDGRTAAVAGKTSVPAGTYLRHVNSIDTAVLTNKHLTLWQGDFIRDGKVVKSVIYAAYLINPDDWETGFKPPVLQEAEIVTAKVGSDVPVVSLDHFVGKYAVAGHPDTPAFEITKEGDVFIFRDLGGPKFEMDIVLRGLEGRRFEMEKGRDNLKFGDSRRDRFCVRYNAAEDRYILDRLGMRGEVQDGVSFPLADLVKIPAEKPEGKAGGAVEKEETESKNITRHKGVFGMNKKILVNLECPVVKDVWARDQKPFKVETVEFVDSDERLHCWVKIDGSTAADGKFIVRVNIRGRESRGSARGELLASREFLFETQCVWADLPLVVREVENLDFGPIERFAMATTFEVEIENITYKAESAKGSSKSNVPVVVEESISLKLVMLLGAINSCAAETDLNIESVSVTERNIEIKGDTSDRANTLKFFDAINKSELEVLQFNFIARDNRDKFRIIVEPKQDWQQWWRQRKTDVQFGAEETVSPKLIMLLVAIKSVATEMDLNIESISISAKSMSIGGDTSRRTDTLKFLDAIKENGLEVSQLNLDARNNRDRFRIAVEPKENWRQWWQKHKNDIEADFRTKEDVVSKQSQLERLLAKPPIVAYDVKLNFADPTVRDGSFHSEQSVAFSLSFHNIEIAPAEKFTLGHLLIGQTTWPIHLEENGITIHEGVAGQKITSLEWPAGESRFEKVIKIPVKYGQKEYSCPVRVDLDRYNKDAPTGGYWFCAYLSGRLPWGAGGRGFEIVNLDQQMEFRLTGDGTDPRDAVLGIDINGDGRIDPAKEGGEQFDLYEPFVIGSKVYQLAEVDPYLPRVVFRELRSRMLPDPLAKADVPVEVEGTGEENQVVWGKPSQGVQVGVKVEKTKWRIGGDVPRLNVEVRVSDPKKFQESGLAGKEIAHDSSAFAVEIDGKQYKQNVFYTTWRVPLRSPFKTVLFLDDEWLGGHSGEEWLTPGRHKIRILFVGLGMRIPSGPVEIEVLPDNRKPEPWPYPWGKAVGGVQVSAHPTQPSWPVGSEPVIRVCMRNQSSLKWWIHEAPSSFAIEVDGKRYENNFIFHVWRLPFAPGDVHQFDLKLSKSKAFHDGLRKGNVWPPVGKPPPLLPGKHTIRVLFTEWRIEPEPASQLVEFEIVPAKEKPDVPVVIGDAASAAAFEELSVKFGGIWIHWQDLQFMVKGDGSVEFSMNKGPKDKTRYKTAFKLSGEHLAQLSELLKKTNWLTAPGANVQPGYTDATRIDISLTREDKVQKVWCHDRNAEPYLSLIIFLKRIQRQEYLLYQMTIPGSLDRYSAFNDVYQQIRAEKGEPVTAHPHRVLDFSRFVPPSMEVIGQPDDNNHEIVAFAARILGKLKVEQARRQITDLTTAERKKYYDTAAVIRTERIRAAAVEVLTELGGEQARLHIRDMAKNHRSWRRVVNEALVESLLELDRDNCVELLKDMASTTREASWGLIRLRPASLPAIVEILQARDTKYTGQIDLIRQYIDHWQEVTKPIDHRVIEAVQKNLDYRLGRGTGWTNYHKEFLKLAGAPELPSKNARQIAEEFLAAVKASDQMKIDEIARTRSGNWPQRLARLEQMPNLRQLEITEVYTDDNLAWAIAAATGTGNENSTQARIILNFLSGSVWRVFNIAIETPEIAERMRKRYIENHPNARPVPAAESGGLVVITDVQVGTEKAMIGRLREVGERRTIPERRKGRIEFLGLDLTDAPHTTKSADLPDLFEERPPGSKSYEIASGVTVIYGGFDGMVYYIPEKEVFYIQQDKLGSSTRTFYGPFDGDPKQVLDRQIDVPIEAEKAGASSGEGVPASHEAGPRITFESLVCDLGRIPQYTKHVFEFKFTNTGNEVLKITRVRTPCACTVPKLTEKEYAPGDSGTLKITYHSGSSAGQIKKFVYVNSNDKVNPIVKLTIKAEIVIKVAHEPKRLNLVLNKENAGCPAITLTSLDNQPFSITEFKSTGSSITADFDSSLKRTSFVIRPKVDMEKLRQGMRGQITIDLDHPECKKITVSFETLTEFKADPRVVYVREAEPQKPITKKVRILSNYNEVFEIESTSSKSGTIKVLAQEKIRDGYEFELEITPPEQGSKRRVFTDVLTVGLKGGQLINITCYGIYSRKPAETAGESNPKSDMHLEVAQSGGDSVYGSGDIVVVSEGKSKVYGSIQEAIDAAPVDSVVRIGPGVYKERLEIDKPLTLEGAGWDKTTIVTENNVADMFEEAMNTFRKRILEAKSEEQRKKLADEFRAQFEAEMKEKMAAQTHLVSDTKNVVIRNLKLTSPGRRLEGKTLSMPIIKFSNAGALMSGCAVVGTPGDGIHVVEGSDVQIRDSLVAGVWSTGIAVASGRDDIARASIINCDVRNCHHRGITIGPGCDSTVVRGCRISGSSWHGIRYDNASPTIIGNLIFANVRFGIYASGRTAADVRQNLFYGNEMSGISCWFKNQDIIEENSFVGNKRSGLEVLGASRPIVRKNIFYSNPTGVFCGNIGNDSPSATSDGTVNLEDNLFWGFEYKVAWRHAGDKKDEVVTEEVELDEKTRNVVFDPECKDITKEDFSLKLDSPARRLGIGAVDLIDSKSPWPLQDEEIPIIPEGETEDTSWMGQISSTGRIERPVVVPVENQDGNKLLESVTGKPRPQEGSEHPGRISGVVISSSTGEPIAGAYVGVGDFGDSGGSNYSRHRSEGFHDKTKTDAEGRFELNGLVFTDKHRELEYHPLVVTHPDFVRHDEKIKLPSGGPVPDVKVSLRSAATIEVTIVDADGNPLQGQWLLRLEALDGRRFIPPGSDPHLSSFASNIWAHWPDLRTQMGVSNGFTFTELDTGEYSIEALKFQLVDEPTPANIWKPTITYHGLIPNIRVQAGQAKQVKLAPKDHQTKLTITAPEFPDKLFDKLERSSQMPPMCLISRSPGALLWDDGRIRHIEDQRLGRIDKKRFFRGFFVQGKPLTINNLPPGSYSLFTMAVYGQVAGYLIGARADLAKGDNITLDIPWRQPTGPSMFGPNRSFDYPVNLEARDYSVSELCEILTDITQSNPRIIADPSIENEKLRFGTGGMSIWDVLEKLYLDKGWRVDEGQDKTLIIVPAKSAVPVRNVKPTEYIQAQEAKPGFGPVIERTVNDDNAKTNMLIDLDTGRLHTPPDDLDNTDIDAVNRWIEAKKIDALGETDDSVRGLVCFDMYVEPIHTPLCSRIIESNQPSSRDLTLVAMSVLGGWGTDYLDKQGRQKLFTKTWMRAAANELPASFVFITREGSVGYLQIMNFAKDPEGIKIRYRLRQEKLPKKSLVLVEMDDKASESKPVKPTVKEPVEHRGRITGVVVNSVTGKPIAGAYVGVGDFGDSGGSNYARHREQGLHSKTETDENGRFELDGLVYTDGHSWLKCHPLVVTHPDFVRHDEKIELLSSGPVPDVKVNLRPAAQIDVTIVDADGNPLEGHWLIRLEALDGRSFIPAGQDRHLSAFASSVWLEWPSHKRPLSPEFSFTELDTGEYSIDVIQLFPSAKVTVPEGWDALPLESLVTYHGCVAKLGIEAGQTKQVKIRPANHQTNLTIKLPQVPEGPFRREGVPQMLLVSRKLGLMLWDTNKAYGIEDSRLGRLHKNALLFTSVPDGDVFTIRNLPPASYCVFAGPVMCMSAAQVKVVPGRQTNVEIPMVDFDGTLANVGVWTLDRKVQLQAGRYNVKELCEVLTAITESNPRIIADSSIGNEKLSFGEGEMSIWDVLEKLYLDRAWRVDEGQDKTLIIKPANQTDLQSNSGQDESNSLLIVSAVDNKAALTTGATVELLGLTYIPVAEDLWWRTDGSPLPKAPFDDVSFTPSVDPNWQQFAYYTVAMQIKGKLPREIGLLKWDFTDAVYAGTTSAYANERRVYYDNIHSGAVKFPKAVKRTKLRLGIVSGDWQTLVKGSHYGVYREGEDSIIVRMPERAGGPLGVHPGEKGLHIGVTYNVTDRDFRVVAVDKDGKVHLSSRGGSGGTDNLRRTTASFPELTHDRLQEFRFQVRPYEWVEFKDVSLRPSEKAFALAGQRRIAKQKELEKWLGQGKERRIREQILILRESRLDHINEPCVEQTEAISAMRELVRIGEPAVQELTTELRQAEHWLEKSLIAFVLRAIGNERSVPALIEVLAQSKYRGEYGIYVKDDELAKFMLDHQNREPDESDRKVHSIIIACPVIEVTKALEKITQHSEGPDHFSLEAAEVTKGRWQKWWDRNRDVFMLPGKPAEQANLPVEGEKTVASSVI